MAIRSATRPTRSETKPNTSSTLYNRADWLWEKVGLGRWLGFAPSFLPRRRDEGAR
jgi:hypothetical protein